MNGQLVFLLEEPSAKAMLEGLLPNLLGDMDISVHYWVFSGWSDLEANIVRRLRYWHHPEATAFIVIRDQDMADCVAVAQRIRDLCVQAGRPDAIVRIACRELESWYCGDLAAVDSGLGTKNLAKRQGQARFRTPDTIVKPSKTLQEITNGAYQKIAGSRCIGPCLSLESNKSHSFNKLLEGIRRALETLTIG